MTDDNLRQRRTIRILTATIVVMAFAIGALVVLVLQRDTGPSPEPAAVAPTGTGISPPAESSSAPAAPASPTALLPAEEPPAPVEPAAIWPGPNTVGGPPSPDFPDDLPRWTLLRSWTVLPRIFEDSPWATAPGPDYSAFPSAQNGCSTGRTLVRWRAVNPTADVVATDLDALGRPGSEVRGNSGWMDLDLCHSPGFRLMGTDDGSTLTDVTVVVQQYLPAP